MQIELTILISVVTVALSAYFGLKNTKRTDTKDIEKRAKENTRINFKLDSIADLNREIKGEVSAMRDDIKAHNDKIIKLEENCKSAHHRIDGIEQRLNVDKEE